MGWAGSVSNGPPTDTSRLWNSVSDTTYLITCDNAKSTERIDEWKKKNILTLAEKKLCEAWKGFKDIRDATDVKNTASVVEVVRSVDRAHELAQQNIEALEKIRAELKQFFNLYGRP